MTRDFSLLARVRAPMLACALAICASPVRPTPFPSQAEWASRVDLEAAERDAQALVTLARLEGVEAAVTAVAVRAGQAALAPARHEPVLLFLARALGELAPDPALEPLLRALAAYESRALAAHPEGPQHGVPAFPVASAAAGARNRWRAEEVRQAVDVALSAADAAWFEARAQRPWSVPETLGFREALSAASPDELHAVMGALESLWAARPELARSAVVAARVLADPHPLRAAMAGPGAASLAPDLARADDILPGAGAVALWDAALESRQAVLRSVALQGLARSGDRRKVLDLLDDPGLGSSAALALAQDHAVDALAAVAGDAGRPSTARRNAVLGLRLEGSVQARAALTALAARSDGLGREVGGWLE